MKQSKRRDAGELIDLLDRALSAYELLLSLSQGQAAAFAKGGAAGLLKVIARKQEVIGAISALDDALRPYTSQWEQTSRALPEPARRAVSAAAADLSDLIHRIIESEKSVERLVAAARDRLAGKARSVAGGLKAEKAYRRGELARTGGILDGEG